jgi:hypothetical protein
MQKHVETAKGIAIFDITLTLQFYCRHNSSSLVVGSLLGRTWAKDIVKKAQRLVTYVNANTRANSLLMQSAKNMGISRQVRTINATQITSVHIMLQSVVKMDQPLHAVLNLHPDDIEQGEVKFIIEDRRIWAGAEVPSKLLVPFSHVVMAIQAKTATVTITTHYWLYLAKSFKAELLPKLTHAGGEMF